jgi:uncharacterized membrane protein
LHHEKQYPTKRFGKNQGKESTMADIATLTSHIHKEVQRREPVGAREMVPTEDINVSDLERLASVVGGGALVLFGLTRRSLGGLALALVGGACLYRGMTGRSPLYQLLNNRARLCSIQVERK